MCCAAAAQSPSGAVSLLVTQAGHDRPVPCRVHLADAAGKPVKPAHLPFWKDHFVCDGRPQFELAPGRYTYVIERGPEYRPVRGDLDVVAGENQTVRVTLERLTDMAARGWWSGDLHIHRPVKDIEWLMAAEDLHVGPVITWWHGGKWIDIRPEGQKLRRFESDRYAYVLGGEDERDGGALLFFGLDEPLPLKDAPYKYPPMTASIIEARRTPGVWIDIEKPFWWDVPLWLATGEADSIGLANNHMCRSRMLDEEAWGRPRDKTQYPSLNGNGYYTQDLYYYILNCGLRLPPSAGSASGVLPNPVGYNRVYVHLGERFDYEAWWKGLKAGRSFVTNGPLLRCRANGELAGHVFAASAGETVRIALGIELESNDPVSKVEVIHNGRVASTHSWDNSQSRGSIGPITFDSSGWFLVRAVADVSNTFRFASTAPYYVQIGPRPRISRASVRFFLDWLAERRGRIKLEDEKQRSETLQYFDTAAVFWNQRLQEATAP